MSTINRSFLRMHKGLFEASVATEIDGDQIRPYFDEPKLEKYLVDYLDENIGKHVQQYETHVVYFDAKSGDICTNHRCNGVKIMLSTEINSFYKYKKARVFTINERGQVNE